MYKNHRILNASKFKALKAITPKTPSAQAAMLTTAILLCILAPSH